MMECNTNTKTHALTLPELNPSNAALSNSRGNINRRDHKPNQDMYSVDRLLLALYKIKMHGL